MKPGKYINHPDNYEALKLCKYGTKLVDGKVTIDGFADKYYKLHPEKPSRTIVAHLKNDNNGYIHYGIAPRGISVREAARIQSFPDWYRFTGPLSFQFKQIGNAVPPMLSFKLAKILTSFLNDGLNGFLDKYQNKTLF
jgi:DNA (cytosine-5)-methyltransferase 1